MLVKEIALKYNVTPSQVALNWLIRFHGEAVVAIPGATSDIQAKENIGAMSFRLSEEDMARLDAEGLATLHEAVKLKTITRIRELYFDLFLAYKNIDLIRERTLLFSRIEDAALARYSSGMGMQQEVLMAQTEKYLLLEKEEMQKQRIQSIEAMLNVTAGRDVTAPLGRPAEQTLSLPPKRLEELLRAAYDHSPEIRTRQRMVAAAEAKVRMAEKEYYPDITLAAGYFNRGGGQFDDMWSLTTTINLPIYYKSKQRQAVLEAEAVLADDAAQNCPDRT